jgi:hypothetical protein
MSTLRYMVWVNGEALLLKTLTLAALHEALEKTGRHLLDAESTIDAVVPCHVSLSYTEELRNDFDAWVVAMLEEWPPKEKGGPGECPRCGEEHTPLMSCQAAAACTCTDEDLQTSDYPTPGCPVHGGGNAP